jgi:hypothetical protein
MNYSPQSLFCHLALLLFQEEVQEELEILSDMKQLQWIESHAVWQVQVTSPSISLTQSLNQKTHSK